MVAESEDDFEIGWYNSRISRVCVSDRSATVSISPVISENQFKCLICFPSHKKWAECTDFIFNLWFFFSKYLLNALAKTFSKSTSGDEDPTLSAESDLSSRCFKFPSHTLTSNCFIWLCNYEERWWILIKVWSRRWEIDLKYCQIELIKDNNFHLFRQNIIGAEEVTGHSAPASILVTAEQVRFERPEEEVVQRKAESRKPLRRTVPTRREASFSLMEKKHRHTTIQHHHPQPIR